MYLMSTVLRSGQWFGLQRSYKVKIADFHIHRFSEITQVTNTAEKWFAHHRGCLIKTRRMIYTGWPNKNAPSFQAYHFAMVMDRSLIIHTCIVLSILRWTKLTPWKSNMYYGFYEPSTKPLQKHLFSYFISTRAQSDHLHVGPPQTDET